MDKPLIRRKPHDHNKRELYFCSTLSGILSVTESHLHRVITDLASSAKVRGTSLTILSTSSLVILPTALLANAPNRSPTALPSSFCPSTSHSFVRSANKQKEYMHADSNVASIVRLLVFSIPPRHKSTTMGRVNLLTFPLTTMVRTPALSTRSRSATPRCRYLSEMVVNLRTSLPFTSSCSPLLYSANVEANSISAISCSSSWRSSKERGSTS
mmetsp:Transcript_29082/g.74666  ORF Transcript_29082/g.74666 Transcript_29082/m.74666 type:complete len:213 (-) Transcript_29082:2162-2800(-)